MDFAKEKVKLSIELVIIVFYLLFFPLGQIARIEFPLVDIVALSSLVLVVSKGLPVWKDSALLPFFLASLFSIIISWRFFPALAYWMRLVSYAGMYILVKRATSKEKRLHNWLFNGLIAISFLLSIFGLLQYFFIPDMRFLYYLGWDDHYYRLVSTFFDPGYTGLILSFGLVLTLVKYFQNNNKALLFLVLIFLVSIALTYSRASYLAVLVGISYLGISSKKIQYVIQLTLLFLLIILFIPKSLPSEGVNLARSYSLISRIETYKSALVSWLANPVFGIGYVRSDASILSLLGSYGVLGLILLVSGVLKFVRSIKMDTIYSQALFVCLIVVLVHSLFNNSLIYTFVLGYLAILGGIL